MYEQFQVQNFRNFTDLKIDGIERINLITGLNDVGKTTLLEAIFLHSGEFNPTLTLYLNVFRGIEKQPIKVFSQDESPWAPLFHDFNINEPIKFIGHYKEGGQRTLSLRIINNPEELTQVYRSILAKLPVINKEDTDAYFTRSAYVLEYDCEDEQNQRSKYFYIIDPRGESVVPLPLEMPYPATFILARKWFASDDVARFVQLEKNKNVDTLLHVLKIIEPRLTKLTILFENGVPQIEGDVGLPKLVPLALMGEGITRLASIVLAISATKNGVVLIDEIENGFHYSKLSTVWQALSEASLLFNAQIFATTHSFECIKAAHEFFQESPTYNFRLHRLEAIGNKINTITYDQGSLSAALASEFEVR